MAFTPYLAFAGDCRAAFTRYQEIFGGELVLLVAHAALTSGDQLLMGADDPTGGFDGHVRGMCVSVDATDVDHAHEVFAALADGGETQMPLTETFFSPAFGMCIDRFGTPWMVVTAQPS